MWKYSMALLFILVSGIMILPKTTAHQHHPSGEALDPNVELKIKQSLVAKDMEMTDELCRNQCLISFKEAISNYKSTDITAALKQLQKEHPHMMQLIWSRNYQSLAEGIAVGKPIGNLNEQVAKHLQEAKLITTRGKVFQSEPLSKDGETYFVLGVPSSDLNSSLIGIVHQSILKEVKDHQIKNLRVVPYPSSGNYKIEAVDPRTLQDVKVDHPEENEGVSHYHKNQIVVKFKNDPSADQLKYICQDIGCTKREKLGYTFVFETDKIEAPQLLNYFKKRLDVQYAEPHFLYLTNENSNGTPSPTSTTTANSVSSLNTKTPNDVLYGRYQWNLPLIETEKGWEIGKGSSDVIVAVIDTGVDLNHPDLQGRLVSGYNFVNNGAQPQDDVGHGTHVAGVIAAQTNNSLGVAGITWNNKIMPIKVLDSSGKGNTYSVAQGVIWATDHGAKVINMSLGNYANAQFLHDAIRYAYDHDVVLVAASGNDNTIKPGFPAAYPEVLAVAAADSRKNKASFSNYGDYIDVTAPGVNIASTYPHNQYSALSGTSMASPHAAALAALVRSVNPSLKNSEVMQVIRDTSIDIGARGQDQYFGYGLIDVVQALRKATGDQAPAVAPDTREVPVEDNGKNDNMDYETRRAPSLRDWFRNLFGR